MYDEICFTSYYDNSERKFYTLADKYGGAIDEKYLIKDCYEVGIAEDSKTGEFVAIEKERIKEFAKQNRVATTDLHVNPFGDLCLSPKNTKHYKENCRDENLFKKKLLIPFLYSHSFFELHKKRPWPDYGHNHLGYLEAYYRGKTPDSKDGTIDTIFYLKDSGFPIRKLSDPKELELLKSEGEEAFNGAIKLNEDIDKYGLNKYLT